ncbi:MAG: pantoate--beta-alanine ligase [Crocinitomicaceae bacterium]|jgi:pantoate--beta-alanine ligase|nr:pantoate--beta-alanine ligase [Crocinitomicaceae bacterium]
MKVCKTVDELNNALHSIKSDGKQIGFVPTMGALHSGHLSLVEQSNRENDFTVVSIFVNPTQFNNQTDLEKYPRTLDQDQSMLAQVDTAILFAPDVSEVYPPHYQPSNIPLGWLGETMEGRYRPGHFEGVMAVVERFFRLVEPHRAYFGRKDFQQVAVIQHMTRTLGLPIQIVVCPTARSKEGLALSSRNMLLSDAQKQEALVLFEAMNAVKENLSALTPNQGKKAIEERIQNSPLEMEYVEIVHPTTLENLTDQWTDGATACVVAYAGKVRLIDNLQLC